MNLVAKNPLRASSHVPNCTAAIEIAKGTALVGYLSDTSYVTLVLERKSRGGSGSDLDGLGSGCVSPPSFPDLFFLAIVTWIWKNKGMSTLVSLLHTD